MTNMIDKLNSGQLHIAARTSRPDCLDTKGNIHGSPARALFKSWTYKMHDLYGDDVSQWPKVAKDEYARKYVK